MWKEQVNAESGGAHDWEAVSKPRQYRLQGHRQQREAEAEDGWETAGESHGLPGWRVLCMQVLHILSILLCRYAYGKRK